jgi:hypothetical protein
MDIIEINPARNRYQDALQINQGGASNPSGIALAFVRGCAAVRAENGNVRTDPALRLIAHQLAYLMGAYELDQIQPVSNHPYDRLTAVCVRHVSLDTVRALGLEHYLIQEAPHD